MTDEGGPIRVLVVDDHAVVREGIKAMLEPDPDFEVVGESDRGAAVVDLVTDSHPDVVLLHARLPDIGGPDQAMKLAERLAEAQGEEVSVAKGRFVVRVSIGVAWSSGEGVDADTIVAQADRAMYESKHEGAGQPKFAAMAAAPSSIAPAQS